MVENTENYYKINTKYSITLTPIDKYQYFGKPNRYNKFHNFVYEQFICNAYEHELFIEVSEPRGFHKQGYSGPRLHLHGYILFRNKKELANFLMDGYYRLTRWAGTDIDTIEDEKKWYSYCTKQRLFKKDRISNWSNKEEDGA